MDFENYLREQTHQRHIFLLVFGLTAVLTYALMDALLYEGTYLVFLLITRLAIVVPILMLAILFAFKSRHDASQWMLMLATSILLLAYSVQLNLTEQANPTAIFAILLQITAFLFLAMHLSMRVYRCLFAFMLVYLAILTYSLDLSSPSTKIFLIATASSLIIFWLWVLVRDQHVREAYGLESSIERQTQQRDLWNSLLRRTLQQQAVNSLGAVSNDLADVSSKKEASRFLVRAGDSAEEIAHLLKRVIHKTHEHMFHTSEICEKYPLAYHLIPLVEELRARYGATDISLNLNSDFLVAFDRALLTRLISNIVDNAVRHRAADTEVTISVEYKNILKISNAGSRFEADIASLIESGKQGENKGLFGLGLFICNQICREHNIKWRTKNENGRAVVEFCFPDVRDHSPMLGVSK